MYFAANNAQDALLFFWNYQDMSFNIKLVWLQYLTDWLSSLEIDNISQTARCLERSK